MYAKFAKLFAALGLIAAIGTISVVPDANAGPARSCYRGVGGGWYCS